MEKQTNTEIDPLTLSIVEARLHAMNEELGTRLFRQCFSVATSHIRDIGTVLFDKDEQMLSIGNFMPVHTGGSDISLKAMLDYIGRENIHSDDFIIGNDPFIVQFGHLADWSFLRPIYYEGEFVFYHFARTHQYDSGGAYPGCYFPGSYDCHGEGLIIPPIKLIERGEIDEKVYSVILGNLRGAEMVRADNMLMFSSMKKVEERIIDMLDRHGKETILAVCNELIRLAEARVRDLVKTWPAGTYYGEAAADRDGTTDKPVWVRLSMTVKPDSGDLIFDFSESDPQCDFINVPLGQVWSSVGAAMLWCMPSGMPRNQGLYKAFELITKEGTCLHPVYPATTASQAVSLGQQVTESVQIAMSQVVPEDTPATWGRSSNPLYAGKRRDRIDPRTGSITEYTAPTFHAQPSSGAAFGFDGVDGSGSSVLGGACVRAPVEVMEWITPYRWLEYEFKTDSAGAGQWRGGLGTHVTVENVYDRNVWQPQDCLTMTGNCDGELFGSVGFMGGLGGSKIKLEIVRNGESIHYPTFDLKYLEPGDIFNQDSGGGGGIGNPLDRDVDKVQRDLVNQYVSVEAARDLYGVVADPDTLALDEKATTALRKKLKKEAAKKPAESAEAAS
jgi:N-methylhydantoinase B